jgi:thioredoxin-related protein
MLVVESFPLIKTAAAPAEKLEWLTLEQALQKNKTKPKKILVDVYTNWCGWCKKMDKQVYLNPEVVKKLNQDFYVVKLNAEQRQPITIQGKTYKYLEKYRAHELALSLLQGQMSYPSTVFLNEQQQVMERVPGYIPPKDFLRALAYLAEK